MFTKKEIKEFIVKLGNKWFFPDFYNKITWYVITLGAGIILTPTPLKLLFYNWLIDSFNLNSGNNISLAAVGKTSVDYLLGFSLILLALLHNIFSKWLIHQSDLTRSLDKERVYAVDSALFQEFLIILSTNSLTIKMLEEHDFGNTFDLESLSDLQTFIYLWNCPEKSFLTSDLEVKKMLLWHKSQDFSKLLSRISGPTRNGRQSVVPDNNRSDWDWPKEVDDDVKALNSMATEAFKLHQDLVKEVRHVLKC